MTRSTGETSAHLEHLYDAWRDFVHFGPFALSAEGMGIGKAFGAGGRIPGLQSIRVFKALGVFIETPIRSKSLQPVSSLVADRKTVLAA